MPELGCQLCVGTAAWNIPKEHRSQFLEKKSLLESYSSKLSAVEINTSFYRHHQSKTYVRWAESVPENFRFSVKLSRDFTHEKKLKLDGPAASELKKVIGDYKGLGQKLGCLLVQLPPKLSWNIKDSSKFFKALRECYSGAVALEARHLSWSTVEVREVLEVFQVSRVWADPAPIPNPNENEFADGNLAYFRLHGFPKIYKSSYEGQTLELIGDRLRSAAALADDVWCIFDNTSYGHATKNALDLIEKLKLQNPARQRGDLWKAHHSSF